MASRVELAWTLAVVVLIAGVGVYSTFLLYNLGQLPPNPVETVTVIGHRFYWQFCYQNQTGCGATNASDIPLWAPAGALIQLNITSTAVVHSFNIPALGVRLDAIPGRINRIAFTVPNTPGTTYLIQCTEFCGEGHGDMRSLLVVT